MERLHAQTVSGKVDNVVVSVGKDRPAGKPALVYTNIMYKDENSNQLLEAWEKGSISFTIKNTGRGTSQRLIISAETANADEVKGLVYPTVIQIDSMAPGKQNTVSIPIEGSLNLSAGIATVTVMIREEYEYDPDEITLDITTDEFKAPKLQITAYRLDAEQYLNLANVPVKLRLVLQNKGQGPASDTRLDIYLPDYAKPTDRPAFVLNNIGQSESRNIEFNFSVRADRLMDEIPVRVVVIERHQKYGLDTILKLRVNTISGNRK
ncbi:hypothetical protein QNI19_26315 [Cytophagaceae bacterium DM2B3-1]|uniref:Uncharacterized protein n=1 Tax=Xanthocytophaga flava TaxID=3048013 RepID=A0ABT7CRW8_9BACT|nr:hypothetical protein [Xanthocytophaga flavus]MDJ1471772.1 hypothetical protein [Xanthocytophaga flavus]MDJ1496478.1 hypothetical protein [Xanthocytophaga flavus]